jgi:uncharacterized protein YjbI with pentapeptide repeats
MNMNQLKPVIIVLLMLTSALAGCTGNDNSHLEQQITDLQESNDEMRDALFRQNLDNQELQLSNEELQLSNIDMIDDIAELELSLELKRIQIDSLISDEAPLRQQLVDLENQRVILQNSLNQSEEFADDMIELMEAINETRDRYYGFWFENWSMVQTLNSQLNQTQDDLFVANSLVLEWQGIADDNRANLSRYHHIIPGHSSDEVTGVYLAYAVMRNANLYRANFEGATLYGANLTGAYMHHSILNNADLRYADLSGADLDNADMTGANFHSANLSGADIRGVWAEYANLSWADLRGADLREGAVLRNANLTHADLTGALFETGNDITGIDWTWAICPDGTNAYDHGQTCANNL